MPPAAPPAISLLGLIMGSMVTQAIHVAARLDVAGMLGEGPLPAAEIAGRAGCDPDATDRLLRVLASCSVFARQPDGRFALTPMAEALRAGDPMSMRNLALLLGHPLHWQDWGNLLMAVRTGRPVLPTLRGMGGYEFLAANPEFAEVFEGAMGNLSDLETEPIAAGYDWARFGTVVDVFGGRGALLAAILRRAAGTRGVLADRRAPALGAEAFLARAGVADRCTIDTGDLFQPPPGGADAYLLKHVVHEWPEPDALRVLTAVRRSIGERGTLLLMEFVLPEQAVPHPGQLVDLWLMVLMGGRERTAAQYADLLARAGFQLTGVVETTAGVSVVEARPV